MISFGGRSKNVELGNHVESSSTRAIAHSIIGQPAPCAELAREFENPAVANEIRCHVSQRQTHNYVCFGSEYYQSVSFGECGKLPCLHLFRLRASRIKKRLCRSGAMYMSYSERCVTQGRHPVAPKSPWAWAHLLVLPKSSCAVQARDVLKQLWPPFA